VDTLASGGTTPSLAFDAAGNLWAIHNASSQVFSVPAGSLAAWGANGARPDLRQPGGTRRHRVRWLRLWLANAGKLVRYIVSTGLVDRVINS
jgi:hypothetical protein